MIKWLITGGVILLPITLIVAYATVHDAKISKLDNLVVGMPVDEVESVLDCDMDLSDDGKGGYISSSLNPFTWCSIHCYFDSDKKYTGSYFHDH
ncbi:hypothetical protein Rhal01_02610 [Rubritalea halochordaticola]|uniref:NVEALA family protein n=1 Tax=Rubritalea halochordaticola TaxID=714537 RepID=A0ABP9V506_9BACT